MNINDFMEKMSGIRKEEERLKREWLSLSTPILYDYGLLPELYRRFLDARPRVCPSVKAGSTLERRIFLFIILFLYSPRTLFGSKMKKGLRPRLAHLYGCDSTLLSYYCRNLAFHYRVYSDFREDIEAMLVHVTGEMTGND